MKKTRRTKPLLMLFACSILATSSTFSEESLNLSTEEYGEGHGSPSSWIRPYLKTEDDTLIWGCRLKNCSHTSYELGKWWNKHPLHKELVEQYTTWFETEGQRIQDDWRNGNVKEADKKYLPLVKTQFWSDLVNNYGGKKRDGSSGYFRYKKLPQSLSPQEDELQAILEAGLKVLHKIYNQREVTQKDKQDFHEFLLAHYSIYYIGGVEPHCLPADAWKTFEKNMFGQANRQSVQFEMNDQRVKKSVDGARLRLFRPGEKINNFKIFKPEYWWNQKEFNVNYVFDTSWHLRPEKLDEVIATYQKLAEEFESTETYPIVKPRSYPEDAPDTEKYSFFYNELATHKKPVFLSSWMTMWDEGNVRNNKFAHLYYRAFSDKLQFLFAEMGYEPIVEKNHLGFNTNPEDRARRILWDHTPYTPQLPVSRMGYTPHITMRFGIVNKDAVLLSGDMTIYGSKADAWNAKVTQMVGVDGYLVECFKNNFSPAIAADAWPRHSQSKFGKSKEKSSANGYRASAYNPFTFMYELIGEVLEVNAEARTLTILREPFHKKNYPNLALMERFNIPFTRDTDAYKELFERFEKEGNSTEARTIQVNVNDGVLAFVNGREVSDESGFKVGDIVSVMEEKNKEYPFILRAIRFNFPPTFGELQNTGKGTAELRGITDNNAVVDQKITVTAKSLDTAIMPHPVVHYKKGVCTFAYTPPPAGETVSVRVTLKDNGGTDFGGNDTTEIMLKITADGATLID